MATQCILHVGEGASSGDIKPIDSKKWDQLVSVVNIRTSFLKKTKYNSVVQNFPKELSSHHGYHTKCHKNFTAVPKITSQEGTTSDIHTRSQTASVDSSRTGVLPRICIFCFHVKSRTGEELGNSVTQNAEKKIRDIAVKRNDTELLNFIGNYRFGEGRDFCALEAKYHHSCRRNYYNQNRGTALKKETQFSQRAFKKLTRHVKDSVIKNNSPELVSALLQRYHEFYTLAGGCGTDLESYTGQNLCKRLKAKFKNSELTIWAAKNKRSPLVCKFGVTEIEARHLMSTENDKNKTVIRNCAEILRNSISKCPKTPLKTDTAENVMKGEVVIPQEVEYFYSKLYNVSNSQRVKKKAKRRLVESSSADALYRCSNQRLLPGKHVSLGLALKSMSGSKRIVKLMN